MKKTTKIWLIAAASLILAGCILFAVVLSTNGWKFSKLSTVRYETNTYEISKPFTAIALSVDTADIAFALSSDGKCRVECYEEETTKHSVTVEKDTLFIESSNSKSWYDYTGFHFGSPKITVYIPKTEHYTLSVQGSTGNVEVLKELSFISAEISLSTGDINFFAAARETAEIKTGTGNICVENNSVGALSLSVSTGKVTISKVTCSGSITIGVSTGKAYLCDITCKSILSSGTTGDIILNHVIATEKLSIERTTGNVKFDGSDAADIFVKTSTGDVTGNLLTDKVFITQTDTGDVDVPQTITGGRCEINTNTGDIKIKIG